jgi:hypothetical protein
MQGLVNFANQFAIILAFLLPACCYCAAIGLFMFGGWGMWLQSQPHNPFRGKPWIPYVAIVLSGACAAFDGILNKVNASAGSNVVVGVEGTLTSYSENTASTGILGNTPGDAFLNIVNIFSLFFQCFGAFCCFAAMMAWWGTVNGRSNQSRVGCAIKFAFGVILINPNTTCQWLVTTLSVQS